VSDEGRFYVKRYSPFTGSTFWVHYVFGDIANADNNYEIFVSNDYLKGQWPLSDRAIDRARADLIKAGFLTVLVKPSPGRRARFRFEFLPVAETGRCPELSVTFPGDSSVANLATDDDGCLSGDPHLPKTRNVPLIGTEEEQHARAIEFAEAWQHYPKKLARKAALKAYCYQRRKGVSADDLLEATKFYAKDVAGQDKRFIMYGERFFGPDDRFLDYVDGVPDGPPAASSDEPAESEARRFGRVTARWTTDRAEALDAFTDRFSDDDLQIQEAMLAWSREIEPGSSEAAAA
jgi:hypothetical protein